MTAIVEGGRDYEVTVNFDKVGVKENVCILCKIKKSLMREKMTIHGIT